MHYLTNVNYECGYTLRLTFEDGSIRCADLAAHLDGEVFEPLKDRKLFQTARLNADIDTVVWDNGADMSPDFLYEISVPLEQPSLRKVAEPSPAYGGDAAGK
jgi:hypothetical protein